MLVSTTGAPIRARMVGSRWEFLDTENNPTGFYIDVGDHKTFKKLGIVEVDGRYEDSGGDLTIYPKKF